MNLIQLLAHGGRSHEGFTLSDRLRLIRLEAKMDLILEHLALTYVEKPSQSGLSPAVQELALHPAQKIAAIKLYREETGAGLKEAKDAVEAFIATIR
jgi:ribosomal protein L7/L12